MDRALPEFNTILHKRWNLENKRMHKKKIQTTTARIDNSLPVACRYPLIKSKKEFIIERKCKVQFHSYIERCSEIEKANRILLNKMTNILSGPSIHNAFGNKTFYDAAKHSKSMIAIQNRNANKA